MQRLLIVFIGMLSMGGCATQGGIYRGSGVDEIPLSACAKCNKVPFYVDGKYINENHK